jgi:hypothetical protein
MAALASNNSVRRIGAKSWTQIGDHVGWTEGFRMPYATMQVGAIRYSV